MNFIYKVARFGIPVVIALGIGYYAGTSANSYIPAFSDTSDSFFVQKSDKYRFTSPLLDCEVYSDRNRSFLQPFQHKLEELQEEFIKKEKLATQISIYFRDLSYGASYGVEEDEQFTPASLLKVPLMIAYLKLAETDNTLLQKELVYTPDPTQTILSQNIQPPETILPGKKYTVDQLLTFMIIDSDNYAQTLLYNNVKGETLDAVYTDLGISIPGVKSTEDYMTVREYASFFRILYNSTYLTRDMSEKALKLLSQVDYNDGLRAGIPSDVPLANKFGERRIVYPDEGREVIQLHDCGIIYYSKRPYLLCIMTRGSSFQQLTSVISRTSQAIYQEMTQL